MTETFGPARTGTLLYTFVAGTAFWLAILLALAYPLVVYLVGRGLLDGTVLVGAIGVHVITLLLGRGYRSSVDGTTGG